MLDKSKWTTMSIEHDVKEQLDNLIIVVHWVPIKSASDKLRYLLHDFAINNQKK